MSKEQKEVIFLREWLFQLQLFLQRQSSWGKIRYLYHYMLTAFNVVICCCRGSSICQFLCTRYWPEDVCAAYQAPQDSNDCVLFRHLPSCMLLTSKELPQAQTVMLNFEKYQKEEGKGFSAYLTHKKVEVSNFNSIFQCTVCSVIRMLFKWLLVSLVVFTLLPVYHFWARLMPVGAQLCI